MLATTYKDNYLEDNAGLFNCHWFYRDLSQLFQLFEAMQNFIQFIFNLEYKKCLDVNVNISSRSCSGNCWVPQPTTHQHKVLLAYL